MLIMSVVLGLIYGVLLPTLPPIPRPLAWGGLLMPLLWTGVSFVVMGAVNPALAKGVNWSWFIGSQFLFGIAAAIAVHPIEGCSSDRGRACWWCRWRAADACTSRDLEPGKRPWYLVSRQTCWPAWSCPVWARSRSHELKMFHANWLAIAIAVHATMSMGFGFIYGLLLPVLRPIAGPLAWGGLVLPLLWTATSHSLMGVVNPLLQERVDWPWFIVSQFVFGVVTAIVVLRSEKVYTTPAGQGPTARSPRDRARISREQNRDHKTAPTPNDNPPVVMFAFAFPRTRLRLSWEAQALGQTHFIGTQPQFR